ncbi:hypothetical protein B0H14DRAFT_2603462 [Mycena olivaceomarginata]|nr:hypothetical protein B0H14DRAFT_2603462 [Mycena olivaceomarginata]
MIKIFVLSPFCEHRLSRLLNPFTLFPRTPRHLYFQSQGIWNLPLYLLKTGKFMDKVQALGSNMQKDHIIAAYLLDNKIKDHLRDATEKKKALSEARYDVEGETLHTKSWTRSAKGYHTKKSIQEFKVEQNGNDSKPQYETRPKNMAQMARDYHDSVQHKDKPEDYGRMLATEITLEDCNVHLSKREFKDMDAELAVEDITEALKPLKQREIPWN